MSLNLSQPSDLEKYLETAAGGLYASHRVSPLTGGYANFVFRAQLKNPLPSGRSTVIVKHAQSFVHVSGYKELPFTTERQQYEVEALRRVAAWLHTPNEQDAFLRVPEVPFFDETNAIIIMDDCCSASSNVMTLKELLIQGKADEKTARKIGAELGRFLSRLHHWGLSSQDAQQLFGKNKQAREITAFVTYGVVVSTLNGQDALEKLHGLEVPQADIARLGEVAARGMEKVLTVDDMVVHGDFWPGNVLAELDNATGAVQRLYVIDWEAPRLGVAGIDVGQFSAEVHLVRRFHPVRDPLATAVLDEFLSAYGSSRGVEIPEQQRDDWVLDLTETALAQIAAHLIAWTPRIPWGDAQATQGVVREGARLTLTGEDTLGVGIGLRRGLSTVTAS